MLQMKGSLLENSLLLGEASPFILFKLSTEGIRPTHIMEVIFFTKSPLI